MQIKQTTLSKDILYIKPITANKKNTHQHMYTNLNVMTHPTFIMAKQYIIPNMIHRIHKNIYKTTNKIKFC